MAFVFPSRRADLAMIAAGFLLSCAIASSDSAFGQAPVAGSPSNAAQGPQSSVAKRVHPHGSKSKKNKAATVEPSPVVERPPAPPPPDWPVNDQAKLAEVAWNGRDLSITAANSTLGQILHDVSVATGVKVEGLVSPQSGQGNQRVYGNYGPASARDVLAQLLEGSGYNVIMVGEQGEGTPRELVLKVQAAGGKTGGTPHANQANQNVEEDVPEEPEPEPQPEPVRQPVPVNGEPVQPPQGGRTPQQMLQEIQQRQQQQQQQQQGQPQPQPPNN